MSYNIIAVPQFRKEIKNLSKKYPSLKEDFTSLVYALREEPKRGVSVGNSCYKIRLAIKSKGKGKSGGARVIINVVVTDETVYLLTIYDKSKKESLSNKELSELLKSIPEE